MTSLWWDHLPEDLRTPLGQRLRGDVDVDVAIVGAGYTGLWTAYYLHELDPGIRIAIIEAEYAGFGASGRNGGWCSALFPKGLGSIAASSSRDDAIALGRTMIDTVGEVGRVVRHEGWDVDWAAGGTVVVARTPTQLRSAEAEVAEARSWGFGADDLRLLDAGEAASLVSATDVLGGTFTPHCAAIQPARLVRSLARHVVAGGGILYEHTPVTSIGPGIAHTDAGDVRASVVVRATEGYTRTLGGQTRAIAPVYSLMLATEPLPAEVWDSIGLRNRETFSDGRHLIIYGQRTADDRLAFGGRGAPYHFGSRITAEQDRHAGIHAGIWRTVTDLFPQLSGVAVTHTWGGPLGVARDWWASCGLDRTTGLAWAGGYVGDGVGTSNLAGRTLADLITGRETDLVALPWVGHRSRPWEPEPLRWLGANAALRAMATADDVETRTGKPSRRAALVHRFVG